MKAQPRRTQIWSTYDLAALSVGVAVAVALSAWVTNCLAQDAGRRCSVYLAGRAISTSERTGNIDDVVARGGRIVRVPRDPQADLELDPPHLPEFNVAVGQIRCPFWRKPDAEAGRDQ